VGVNYSNVGRGPSESRKRRYAILSRFLHNSSTVSSGDPALPSVKNGLLLIRYQQPQNRVVANTSLANEGCGIGFGTGVVVDTAETDVLDPVA